jgi:hypothetical protein
MKTGRIGSTEAYVTTYQPTPLTSQKSEDFRYTAAEDWNLAYFYKNVIKYVIKKQFCTL